MSRWRRSPARKAAPDRAQRRRRRRRRADRRRPGRRLSRAAQDQCEAASRSRQGTRRSRRASRPTATGPTRWPRSRRRCWRARSRATRPCSADARPALLLAEHTHNGAALYDHYVRSDLAHGRRSADVALGLERPSLVNTVAGRAKVAENPGAEKLPAVLCNLFPSLFGRPADGSAISAAAARDIDDDVALRVGPLAVEGLSGRRRRRSKRHRGRCNAQENAFHGVHLAGICGENRSLRLRQHERKRLVLSGTRTVRPRPDLRPAHHPAQDAARYLQSTLVDDLDLAADAKVEIRHEYLAFPLAIPALPETAEQAGTDKLICSLLRRLLCSLCRPGHGPAHCLAARGEPDEHGSLGIEPVAFDRAGRL